MWVGYFGVLASSLALSCRHMPDVGTLRFVDAPPVVEVDDQRDTAKPETRDYYPNGYAVQYGYHYALHDTLGFHARTRAMDINAAGEVPNSSWFENRVGTGGLTPAQVRVGPSGGAPAMLAKPWTILSGKEGGAEPGFLIRDAQGQRYLLKFDHQGFAELETATDVISQRLLWAVGYHVPDDQVVHFDRSDIQVAADAYYKNGKGEKVPLTAERVDSVLAGVERSGEGSYRALTSRFLRGVPTGGYPQEGVRRGDPNDTIPHEHRRSLRGQYVFFAWLSHTDVKDASWISMWTETPGRPGEHHLRHYLVDFGKSLGVFNWIHDRGDGHTYSGDHTYVPASLLSFGLWTRPWERVPDPEFKGLGRFDVDNFHPARFKPRLQLRFFSRRDALDDFWAAKILMRLTPEHLKAAVDAGELSDPRAAEALLATLLGRQRKLARWAFSRVTPLDEFTLRSGTGGVSLCAVDLWTRYGFAEGTGATIHGVLRDAQGRPLRELGQHSVPRGGAFCLDPIAAAELQDLRVVEVELSRDGQSQAPVFVHLGPKAARTLGTDAAIVGIDREASLWPESPQAARARRKRL